MAAIDQNFDLELFKYEQFEDKFKPKKTTDDCHTPENIYNAVRDWACKRYGIDPAKVVRPFWPGADYQQTDYPDGCAVIDNPPFSIFKQIVQWYMARGIRFLLFSPGLTLFNSIWIGATTICTGNNITYENGAQVNTGFVTNMEDPDIAAMSCPELFRLVDEINTANQKIGKKKVTKLAFPDEIITAAKLNWLSIHGEAFTVRRKESAPIWKLDNYGKGIFGNGLLLSERAAAERAAAERAAAERAAAERAAAKRVHLSERELQLQKMLGGAK